jgi:hypothetical protein
MVLKDLENPMHGTKTVELTINCSFDSSVNAPFTQFEGFNANN